VPDPCSVRVDAPRELARPEAAKQLAGGESARAGASLDARSGHNKRRPRGCARYMTASDGKTSWPVPMPHPGRPPRAGWASVREPWLVTAVLGEPPCDWPGPHLIIAAFTIACKRPGKRAGPRAQSPHDSHRCADLTVFLSAGCATAPRDDATAMMPPRRCPMPDATRALQSSHAASWSPRGCAAKLAKRMSSVLLRPGLLRRGGDPVVEHAASTQPPILAADE
jgi:hypothetical protein